ncbi:quinol:cytochrome c oxidoreductase pentaheme cytochrome subunit [Marinoscillum furvescens DSM 4134]|uniref:Quinol:cytochrome c oxidoreductase pentaheme cytochrome subunit n=2 Tax=Marinoscillum furvescens TaxID=1026 RepID=A0A3D9L242_MARFU|nr:quinol:cytochrome c oxidoreductase pentaheme cytochrome subunit [Marinoscillum furvescens DSM 4134]
MSIAPRFVLTSVTYLLFLFISFGSLAQDEAADGIPTDDALVSAGESLFKANCTQCHAINEKVIGPALKDVHERRSKEWLISWIRNSQKLIQSGDETAVALWEEYNKTAMPAYPFSDEEITSLLSYVKVESSKEPEAAPVAADAGAGQTGTAASGDSVSSGYVTAILVVLIVVLVLILVVLGLIVSVLTKYLKDQKDLDGADEEIVNQRINLQKVLTSDFVIGSVVFLFVALLLKTAIDGAFTIGVQQGYQPTQPIAFSHKIHAGQYEIDCNYCHTGVRKSKAANIPSANICMNCHTAIKTESPEIQKIYAAIDYDPSTGEYGENTKPIEWVRIHNLPDLAYFNHSQHVKVGGLECQTCHGPIEEMDVVYQYSSLTMGWCINCHRETEVNTKDNEYYNKLVELHAEHSKEPMKVEDIGGLECSKCHY